jgi:hypothetical protein
MMDREVLRGVDSCPFFSWLPYNCNCVNYMDHWPSDKLMVTRLVKKFPAFFARQKVVYCVLLILPPDSVFSLL